MTRTGRQILVVSPHVPAPWFGSGTRIYQLVRQLAMRHQVTVVCPAAPGEEADVERLRSLGVKVHAVASSKLGRPARRLDQMVSLVSPLPFHVREHRTAAMREAVAGFKNGGVEAEQARQGVMGYWNVQERIGQLLGHVGESQAMLQRLMATASHNDIKEMSHE